LSPRKKKSSATGPIFYTLLHHACPHTFHTLPYAQQHTTATPPCSRYNASPARTTCCLPLHCHHYAVQGGTAISRVTLPPGKIPTSIVVVKIRGRSTAAHQRGGRKQAPPPSARPAMPPHPPPAEPPATTARDRRCSRGRLAAPPSSKLLLRRSATAPGLPSNPAATSCSSSAPTHPHPLP
jgi:hypothetical protein